MLKDIQSKLDVFLSTNTKKHQKTLTEKERLVGVVELMEREREMLRTQIVDLEKQLADRRKSQELKDNLKLDLQSLRNDGSPEGKPEAQLKFGELNPASMFSCSSVRHSVTAHA